MNKDDIKAGELYAYRYSHRNEPRPVMFLQDGPKMELFRKNYRGRFFSRLDPEKWSPSDDSGGRCLRGYAAAILASSFQELGDKERKAFGWLALSEAMAAFRNARASLRTGNDLLAFTVITDLSRIYGPFFEEWAKWSKEKEAKEQARQESRQRREVCLARLENVRETLGTFGIDSEVMRATQILALDPENAGRLEKLLNSLSAR